MTSRQGKALWAGHNAETEWMSGVDDVVGREVIKRLSAVWFSDEFEAQKRRKIALKWFAGSGSSC